MFLEFSCQPLKLLMAGAHNQKVIHVDKEVNEVDGVNKEAWINRGLKETEAEEYLTQC